MFNSIDSNNPLLKQIKSLFNEKELVSLTRTLVNIPSFTCQKDRYCIVKPLTSYCRKHKLKFCEVPLDIESFPELQGELGENLSFRLNAKSCYESIHRSVIVRIDPYELCVEYCKKVDNQYLLGILEREHNPVAIKHIGFSCSIESADSFSGFKQRQLYGRFMQHVINYSYRNRRIYGSGVSCCKASLATCLYTFSLFTKFFYQCTHTSNPLKLSERTFELYLRTFAELPCLYLFLLTDSRRENQGVISVSQTGIINKLDVWVVAEPTQNRICTFSKKFYRIVIKILEDGFLFESNGLSRCECNFHVFGLCTVMKKFADLQKEVYDNLATRNIIVRFRNSLLSLYNLSAPYVAVSLLDIYADDCLSSKYLCQQIDDILSLTHKLVGKVVFEREIGFISREPDHAQYEFWYNRLRRAYEEIIPVEQQRVACELEYYDSDIGFLKSCGLPLLFIGPGQHVKLVNNDEYIELDRMKHA